MEIIAYYNTKSIPKYINLATKSRIPGIMRDGRTKKRRLIYGGCGEEGP
jgi:hypothetical protein